jgi:hypothetical protein
MRVMKEARAQMLSALMIFPLAAILWLLVCDQACQIGDQPPQEVV